MAINSSPFHKSQVPHSAGLKDPFSWPVNYGFLRNLWEREYPVRKCVQKIVETRFAADSAVGWLPVSGRQVSPPRDGPSPHR